MISVQQNVHSGTQQLGMVSPFLGIPYHEYALGAILRNSCGLVQRTMEQELNKLLYTVQLEVSFPQGPHEYQDRELKLHGE